MVGNAVEVDTATDCGVVVRFPVGGRGSFIIESVHPVPGAHSTLRCSGLCEADHSPPFVAEVHEWSYPCMDRGSNPCGGTLPDDPGAYPAPSTMGTGSLSRG